MKLRNLIQGLVLLASAFLVGPSAGQTYPGKPVRFILSYSARKPGAIARLLNGVLACACVLTYLSAYPALAAEPAATQPGAKAASAKRFGVVWRIRGDVTTDPGNSGNARNLRSGDPVFVGDYVRAAATGEAVLKTDDAGMVAIRPGAEFVAESFAADGKTTDHQTLRLITGSLRIISGWIGHLNRPAHRVITPMVTIGIRGTDHEPYVLSADMAASTSNKEGAYDKVNRGSTALDPDGQALVVPAGRVGFAPALASNVVAPRGLMTLLLPVLLDKVPGFYVPGKFDTELNRYSRSADALNRKELEKKRKIAPAAPATEAAPTTTAAPAAATTPATPATPVVPAAVPTTAPAPTADCVPATIAREWLARFDRAIARREAAVVIALFAPEVAVRANVRGADGNMSSINLGREDLAQSTIASVKQLTNYQQRRISLEATAEASNTGASCDRVKVRSVAIEQGQQAGKPYRFESMEEFLLEKRAGNWLAVRAETTQR